MTPAPSGFSLFRQGLVPAIALVAVRMAVSMGTPAHTSPASAAKMVIDLFMAGLIACAFSMCATFTGIAFLTGQGFSGQTFARVGLLCLALLPVVLSTVVVFVCLRAVFLYGATPTPTLPLVEVLQVALATSAVVAVGCLVMGGHAQAHVLAAQCAVVFALVALVAVAVLLVCTGPRVVRAVQQAGFERMSAHAKLRVLAAQAASSQRTSP